MPTATLTCLKVSIFSNININLLFHLLGHPMSTSRINLEQGSMFTVQYQNSETDDEEDFISICFSDAEEGSCYSTLYSAAGGSSDEGDDVSGSRRDSSASDCSVYVEIRGVEEDGDVNMHLDDDDEEVGDRLRECRICHLSFGVGTDAIKLECHCKNDLALAHSNCARRWFQIRGNRICEICNSAAENVLFLSEPEPMQYWTATSVPTIVTAPPEPPFPVGRPETTNSTVENVIFVSELELMQYSTATNSPTIIIAPPESPSPVERPETTNSTTENVIFESELEQMRYSTATGAPTIVTATLEPPFPVERPETTRSFWRGHRFLNFLLACMVFAFVISWLFHFNMPS